MWGVSVLALVDDGVSLGYGRSRSAAAYNRAIPESRIRLVASPSLMSITEQPSLQSQSDKCKETGHDEQYCGTPIRRNRGIMAFYNTITAVEPYRISPRYRISSKLTITNIWGGRRSICALLAIITQFGLCGFPWSFPPVTTAIWWAPLSLQWGKENDQFDAMETVDVSENKQFYQNGIIIQVPWISAVFLNIIYAVICSVGSQPEDHFKKDEYLHFLKLESTGKHLGKSKDTLIENDSSHPVKYYLS